MLYTLRRDGACLIFYSSYTFGKQRFPTAFCFKCGRKGGREGGGGRAAFDYTVVHAAFALTRMTFWENRFCVFHFYDRPVGGDPVPFGCPDPLPPVVRQRPALNTDSVVLPPQENGFVSWGALEGGRGGGVVARQANDATGAVPSSTGA